MNLLSRLSREAEEAEVATIGKESTVIQFEANRLASRSVAETRGRAVRVIRDGRLGFSASTNESAEDWLVRSSLESASFGSPATFSFALPEEASLPLSYDGTLAGLSLEALVGVCEEIVASILDVEPQASCRIWLDRSIVSLDLVNSRGLEASCRSTPLLIRLQVDKIEGDDFLSLVDYHGATVWDGGHRALAARLGRQLELSRSVMRIEPRRMPVVFSPSGMLALTTPLCEALNGKSLVGGASPLGDKAGQRIVDDRISLSDDGTLRGGFLSAARDDEGVPRKKTALIEDGILKGFIHDLRTASQTGAASTGNSSRGNFAPFALPEPAFTNLVIEAGGTPLADLIASVDEGILVESAMGLGMGNPLSGAFSNPLSLAFLIRKGEVVGRVKDLSIAGNVYEVLSKVAAISQERAWTDGSLCSPYVLVEEMSVAGKCQGQCR